VRCQRVIRKEDILQLVLWPTLAVMRRRKSKSARMQNSIPAISARRRLRCFIKLAFHGADTDTDSPDTSIHPYVRYAQFPREDLCEDVGVRVGVGDVECQLYGA